MTWAPTIVTVQVSLFAKSTLGLSVKVVGPPDSAAAWPPLVAQLIENHDPATVTGSENVIETLLVVAMLVAPSAGDVAVTVGAVSAAPTLLSGSGGPAVKSALLLSVSVAPPAARIAAVVLLSARGGAGALEEVGVPVADEVDDPGERGGDRTASSRRCNRAWRSP